MNRFLDTYCHGPVVGAWIDQLDASDEVIDAAAPGSALLPHLRCSRRGGHYGPVAEAGLMTLVRPVIMCGGSGTRLWPLSRKSRPRDLLPLLGGRSLLQNTATRLNCGMAGLDILPPLVVTSAAQADAVEAQFLDAGIEPAAILIEPDGRNTDAVAAAAVAWSETADDEALLLLLRSDHHIARPDAFAKAVAQGAALAAEDRIVTFGIMPDRPHTGYGYIRRGEALGAGFAVDRFVEKPDAETASAYLADGRYSWSAGIFLFEPAVMSGELTMHVPGILETVSASLSAAHRAGISFDLPPVLFAKTPSAPIDKAVMEKAAKAAVIPVDMGWSDVGSWSSLFEVLGKDERGNAVSGPSRVIANECSEDVRKVVDGLNECEAKDLL